MMPFNVVRASRRLSYKLNLRYYSLISRFLFPRFLFRHSYTGKIVLVAVVAMHGPIAVLMALFPPTKMPSSPPPGTLPPIYIVLMVGIGMILMVLVLLGLLQPMTACSQSLRDYMDQGILPNLPTDGKDQAGILMSDLQQALVCLDQLLKDQERRGTHDPLTGIGNRAWSDLYLEEGIMHAKSKKVSVCLSMIDLDHFKEINDEYGHETGDRVLQQMACILKEEIRADDWVARWGGDEFVLLFWDCDAQKAEKILSRIKKRVQPELGALAPNVSQISVSIGLCQYDGVDKAGGFFVKADSALYAAKMGGRDRIVLFEPELRLISEKLRIA